MSTPYDLSVARHRFSAWAACRAAQAGSAKAKRHELLAALARSGVIEYLKSPPAEELTQQQFDQFFISWVEAVISHLKGRHNKTVSFGVGAKLISTYLKGAYVLGDLANSRLAYLIHPPIDSILLKAIDRAFGCQFSKQYRWQKLDRTHYLLVVEGLRRLNGERPFWQIEEHWEP